MEQVLENLEAYILAEEYGDLVWKEVECWDHFQRITIGKQLVTSSDSISANIAEGYGRFNYKEKIQFFYYARGSLKESQSWIGKSFRRKIITTEAYENMLAVSERAHSKLNGYIKYTKGKSRSGKKNKSADNDPAP